MSNSTPATDLFALVEDQLASQQLELPVLPTVAAEILPLCQDESVDAARLSSIIHRDQALAAHVLRVANSAAHVGSVPCSSLQQAVSRLGMRCITEIVVAVAVKGRLFGKGSCIGVLQILWRHSVLTASFTKEIARARRRNVEIAFLCGLLHDIGKAVLLTNIDRLLGDHEVSMDELSAALQCHHARAGRMLAEQWKMPDQIVECIEHHDSYEAAPRFGELAMTVCLANLIANSLTVEDQGRPVGADGLRRHPVLASLNIYPDQLDELFARSGAALELAGAMA